MTEQVRDIQIKTYNASDRYTYVHIRLETERGDQGPGRIEREKKAMNRYKPLSYKKFSVRSACPSFSFDITTSFYSQTHPKKNIVSLYDLIKYPEAYVNQPAGGHASFGKLVKAQTRRLNGFTPTHTHCPPSQQSLD